MKLVLLLFYLDQFIIFTFIQQNYEYYFKVFRQTSKKRDLSGESNPEEERKKVREGSSETNKADDTIDDEVFQQTNSTSDISEILVSFSKLEAKVTFAMKQNLCKLKEKNNLLN